MLNYAQMEVRLFIVSEFFKNYMAELQRAWEASNISNLSLEASLLAKNICQVHIDGRSLAIFGNGGSCADANHWVGELVCSYKSRKRPPINALSLSANTPVITAWSNDFSFDTIFSRQITALSPNLRLVIALSTSGTSSNILAGLSTAKRLGCQTYLITGNSVIPPQPNVDHLISFSTSNTPIIQTLTTMFFHSVCEEIDELCD